MLKGDFHLDYTTFMSNNFSQSLVLVTACVLRRRTNPEEIQNKIFRYGRQIESTACNFSNYLKL